VLDHDIVAAFLAASAAALGVPTSPPGSGDAAPAPRDVRPKPEPRLEGAR